MCACVRVCVYVCVGKGVKGASHQLLLPMSCLCAVVLGNESVPGLGWQKRPGVCGCVTVPKPYVTVRLLPRLLSRQVVEKVAHRLLVSAVADTSERVRVTVLTALHGSTALDEFLAQVGLV